MANLRTQLSDKRKFAVVFSHNEKVLEICEGEGIEHIPNPMIVF